VTAALKQDWFATNSSVMAQHCSTHPVCLAHNTRQTVKTKAAAHSKPQALFGNLQMDFMLMSLCCNYKYILVIVNLFLEMCTLQKIMLQCKLLFLTLSHNFEYEVHSHSWRFHKIFSGGLPLSQTKPSAPLWYELYKFQWENPIPLKDEVLRFLPYMFQASQMVSLLNVIDRFRPHCLEIVYKGHFYPRNKSWKFNVRCGVSIVQW